MSYRTKDSTWVKQAFMQLKEQNDKGDVDSRTYSTANMKFTDTSLGGNFVINPLPQYCKFTDPTRGGRYPMRSEVEMTSPSHGMGRYYSEAIDDHNQIITMRFGVAQFNSLWSFYSAAVNGKAARLARTGRGSLTAFEVGQAAAYTVSSIIGAIPLFLYRTYRFFTNKPVTKYYYLKPAMTLYWDAVSSMLNSLAVNMGIAPYARTDAQSKYYNDGGVTADPFVNGSPRDKNPDLDSLLQKYAAAMPGIFQPDGRIDVFAMATKAQRLADVYYKNIQNIMENNTSEKEITDALKQFSNSNLLDDQQHMTGIQDYRERYFRLTAYSGDNESTQDSASKSTGSKSGGDANDASSSDGTSDSESIDNWKVFGEGDGNGLVDLAKAELEDGAAFVSFRVDATGPVSESFSSTIGESDVSQKINSISSQNRQAEFDVAGGALTEGLGKIVEAAKGFVSGTLDAIGLSGLSGLAGSAFFDIPETWQSSMANLPTSSYTITLRSPYGNKLSRYMYLYVPLCMLLAGALPLATGPSSYTSPFLCELYSRYRSQCRLGMIDSMQITRGGGNLPFGVEDGPLQIDITFSVKDMSSILYMPIYPSVNPVAAAGAAIVNQATSTPGNNSNSNNNGASAADAAAALLSPNTYSEDNSFTDYMAVLGGLSLRDQVYSSQKWRLNMAKQMLGSESWRSPGRLASIGIGTLPGRILNSLARATNRP
jgi:hypothetical protein